jgi:hypothetical protein
MIPARDFVSVPSPERGDADEKEDQEPATARLKDHFLGTGRLVA